MNKVRMQTDRAKIWKVIRAHKEEFTSADIEMLTDATYVNIKRYLSFEPTYEELKLKAMRVTFGRSMGFEPTYEELKF